MSEEKESSELYYGSFCNNCKSPWKVKVCSLCTHTFKEEMKEEQKASRDELYFLRERINNAIRELDQKETLLKRPKTSAILG